MPAIPKPERREKEKKYSSLKPGKPLTRKTPLKAKPAARKPASKRSYAHLQKRGCCAICGAEGRTVWHHIVYRSQGGGENDANMLELGHDFTCACHREIHAGEISRAKVLAVRRKQGSYLKQTGKKAAVSA